MKKILWLCITILLVMCFAVSASADIGALVFTVNPEESAAEEEDKNLLSKLETDLDGSLYPYTGIANGERKYTVMLYLCGSDLEGSIKNNGAATKDLKEIIKSNYNQDEVSVLVMAGGSLKWYNDAVDIKDTAIYELVGSALVKRNSGGLSSMSSAETLSSFINYGLEHYPAEKNSLIIWDHGGGPVGHLVADTLSSSSMTVLTLRDAFENSKAAKQKLDWVGFDACLMCSVEVAKTLIPYADYMVASAETEPARGWNYSFLNGIEKDKEFSITARRILDTYMEQNADIQKSYSLTLSCIDLSKIGEVEALSNSFFEDVAKHLNTESFNALTELRQNTLFYRTDDLDLIDLKDLVVNLRDYSSEKADHLITSIDAAVLETAGNVKNSSGLSTYYPYYNISSYDKERKELYDHLNYSDHYTAFIHEAVKLQSGKGVNWTSLSLGNDATRDTRTNFTFLLTPEQAQSVAECTLVIVRECRLEDGTVYYVVVNPAGPVEIDQTQLSGDYVHNALFAVGGNGDKLCEMPLVWSLDDKGYYLINATLVNGEESVPIQLVCTLNEENSCMEIAAIRVWDEMGQYYSDRYSIDLNMFESISFAVPRYVETRDESGALVGIFKWDTLEEEVYTLPLKGDWTLQMILDSIDTKELLAGFVITDYQRRTHTNELMPVQPSSIPMPVFVLTYDDDHLLLNNSVSENNGDIYILFTATNVNEQEVFIHFDQVVINGNPVDTELWIEGDGENGGIPAGEQSTDTLVLPGLGTDDAEPLQTIALVITVVNAANDTEIARIDCSGYLSLPNN